MRESEKVSEGDRLIERENNAEPTIRDLKEEEEKGRRTKEGDKNREKGCGGR